MNRKVFAQRFNRELSGMSFPDDLNEKVAAVAKVFGVNRHLANALIFGHIMPSDEQIKKIAAVIEVCPQWLGGKTDKRKAYSLREERETV